MYLPFGLRLQDQSAFILTASGINMTTPDQGAVFGWERGRWDIQLAVSNGKQWSSQFTFVQPVWRLGVAANDNDQAVGAKTAYAIFGGLRTGPIAWLAQAEITDEFRRTIPSMSGSTSSRRMHSSDARTPLRDQHAAAVTNWLRALYNLRPAS